MSATKYNISKPKKYLVNGVEKTFWQNVGTMTEFHKQDGSVSRIMEIPAIGLEANIFPITPKEEPRVKKSNEISVPMVDGIDYPTEDINPEDIPF